MTYFRRKIFNFFYNCNCLFFLIVANKIVSMIYKIIFYVLNILKTIIKFSKYCLTVFFKVNRIIFIIIFRLFELITYWWTFKCIVRTRKLWILFFIRVLRSANMYCTFSLDEIKRYNEAYSYVNGARFFVLRTEFKENLTEKQKKLIIDDFNLKFSNLPAAKTRLINEVNEFKTIKINNMSDLINKSNLYKPIKIFLLKRKLILWYLAVINIKIKIIKEKILKKIEEFKEKIFKKIEEFKKKKFKKFKKFKKIINNINNINKVEKNIFKKIFLIIKEIFFYKEIKEEIKEEVKIKTKTETEKIWSDFKNKKYLIKEYSYKIAAWNEYSEDNRFKFWDFIYF